MLLLACSHQNIAIASCDCGSTDSTAPCTGNSIIITVDGNSAIDAQYNWAFNSGGGDANCGQFANGDYWIAPSNGQDAVTITGITSSTSTVKAAENPTVEAIPYGTGGNNYGNYDSSTNIIESLPKNYTTATSIVAAANRNEAVEGGCGTSINGECINSYAVVTILPSVPENAGATVIRPNITGTSKEILKWSDFDLSKFPAKSFLAGTDAAGLEAIRRRWSHSVEIFGLHNSVGTSAGYCSEGGRAFRAKSLVGDYGGYVAKTLNDDIFTLFSDDNDLDTKRPAIAAILAYGLDMYHAMYDTGGAVRAWGVGAGQHPGKFTAPVILAALEISTAKRSVLMSAKNHIYDTRYTGPHELAQIRPGVTTPIWGDVFVDDNESLNQGAYWAELWLSQRYDGATGVPEEYGAKTQVDPYGYIDGPSFLAGDGYMSITYAVQRAMLAIGYIMPEFYRVVNFPELDMFVRRVNASGIHTSPDPCVTPDAREVTTNGCTPYNNRAACVYYNVTWGPVDNNDASKGCITTPTPPYTQQGRFASRDGLTLYPNSGYISAQAESNWEAIMALGTPQLTNRWLFRNVRLPTEE